MTRARHLRLAVAVFARARMLPWQLRRDLPLAQMLALATPPEGAPYRGIGAAQVARAVNRALRHPLMMRDRRCLREGVLCFRFLRAAGFEPRLHFGVEPGSVGAGRLSAHCWVTLDGQVLAGETAAPMVALHVHPAEGPGQAGRATGAT